jgi:hypothetical protein
MDASGDINPLMVLGAMMVLDDAVIDVMEGTDVL